MPVCFWMLTLTGVEMWGYGWFSCLEWKLWGLFGLLTGVKGYIHSQNGKRGIVWGYLVKTLPEINKTSRCEPTHLCF